MPRVNTHATGACILTAAFSSWCPRAQAAMKRVADAREGEWKLGKRRVAWATDAELMLRVMLRHIRRVAKRTYRNHDPHHQQPLG